MCVCVNNKTFVSPLSLCLSCSIVLDTTNTVLCYLLYLRLTTRKYDKKKRRKLVTGYTIQARGKVLNLFRNNKNIIKHNIIVTYT